jgi:hypothetical protein
MVRPDASAIRRATLIMSSSAPVMGSTLLIQLTFTHGSAIAVSSPIFSVSTQP